MLWLVPETPRAFGAGSGEPVLRLLHCSLPRAAPRERHFLSGFQNRPLKRESSSRTSGKALG